jgi:hypothetical protein
MRELSAQGKRAAYRRNVAIAETALAISQQLVPVDSGDLKSTGRVEKNPRTGTASLMYGGLAKSGEVVDYVEPVEADQPFIKPAVRLAIGKSRNRTFRTARG